MRVSKGLKSLTHGVSTDAITIRDSKYLDTQLNMQTVLGQGLQKRPPSQLLNSGMVNHILPETPTETPTVIVTSYPVQNDIRYFVLVVEPNNPNNYLAKIYSSSGTVISTIDDTTKYLRGITKKSQLEIQTQQDTVFVLNKTRTILTEPSLRTTLTRSSIRVALPPHTGATLNVNFKDNTGVVQNMPPITVGTNTGTDFIAAQIVDAITLMFLPNLTVASRGSIVEFTLANGEYAAVSAEDDANGTVLQTINGSVQSTLDLPKYTTSNQIITIEPIENQQAGRFYVVSKPIRINPQGEPPPVTTQMIAGIHTHDNGIFVTVTTGHDFFTTGSSINPPVIIDGHTIGAIYLTHRSDQSTTDLYVDGTYGNWLPVDLISRITIRDTLTQNTVVDSYLNYFVGNYRVVGLPGTIELTEGRQYDIWFDETPGVQSSMIEVQWEETSAAGEYFALSNNSMPHKLTSAGLEAINWDTRNAGDNKTNPFPKFVGNTINTLAIFQNRLVAIQDDTVITTETDNNLSWFRNTVTQLLPSHPVSIQSTSEDSDTFHSTLNHNRDLLLFSDAAQFKLSGDIALTPQTAGLPQTTKYLNNSAVQPLSLGKNIYFAFTEKNFTGISRYQTGEQDIAQDVADPITEHVKKYLPPNPNKILGVANEGIIYVVYNHDVYTCVYDPTRQITNEALRFAWSKWSNFTDGITSKIADATILNTDLLLFVIPTEVHATNKGNILLLSDIETQTKTPALDYTTTLTSSIDEIANTEELTLPANYPEHATIRVTNTDTLISLPFTRIGDTLSMVDPSIIPRNLNVGLEYNTLVVPSSPRVKDQSGLINPSTKLSILNWSIYVTDSADIKASIVSPYYATITQSWSGLIARDINSQTDNIADNTAIIKVPFQKRTDLASLHLNSNSHLPMNITHIDWQGRYTSRGRRF